MKNCTLFFFLLLLIPFSTIIAQETTGGLIGVVYDEDKVPLSYATVTIKDNSTNEVYNTYSQDNGSYKFYNLTPSTYVIEVSYVGYQTRQTAPMTVKLGQESSYDVVLYPESYSLKEIEITGTREVKDGSGYVVSSDLLDDVPVIYRSIQELSRINPENNLNSFGGASHRFNNLNIDGVATNDIIGFQEPASGAAGSQANGTPGSLSKSQPIGFAAIKELSIKLTPFDVSIGTVSYTHLTLPTIYSV